MQTPFRLGWHMQREKGELTSCRCTVQSAWQYLQLVAKEEEPGCPKGKWPPRGTGTTVLTYPRSAPGGTGKAGENGQNSMGGSSPWRRPSAPECGDTQVSCGRPALNLEWGSSSKTAPESLSTGSPAGRTLPHVDGSMYSQAYARAGKSCGSQLEVER